MRVSNNLSISSSTVMWIPFGELLARRIPDCETLPSVKLQKSGLVAGQNETSLPIGAKSSSSCPGFRLRAVPLPCPAGIVAETEIKSAARIVFESADRITLTVQTMQGREAHHIHCRSGSCKLFSGKTLFPGGALLFHLLAWYRPTRRRARFGPVRRRD